MRWDGPELMAKLPLHGGPGRTDELLEGKRNGTAVS
jgi:hypothetical protein